MKAGQLDQRLYVTFVMSFPWKGVSAMYSTFRYFDFAHTLGRWMAE